MEKMNRGILRVSGTFSRPMSRHALKEEQNWVDPGREKETEQEALLSKSAPSRRRKHGLR